MAIRRLNRPQTNAHFERWHTATKRLISGLRTHDRRDWHSSSALAQAQFVAREIFEFSSRCHVQVVHLYRADGSFEDFIGHERDVWTLWPPGKAGGRPAELSLVRFLAREQPRHLDEHGAADREAEDRVISALQSLQDGSHGSPAFQAGYLEASRVRVPLAGLRLSPKPRPVPLS